jgi:hypothetical protein
MARENYKGMNNSESISHRDTEISKARRLRKNFKIPNSTSVSFVPLCLCVMLIPVFLFISCRTIPILPDAFLQEASFIPLNSGASIYIFADVKQARSIIALLPIEELRDRQVAQMMDRTDFAVVAMFPPESGQRFQLAAWGNYPSSRAGFGFTFNRNWQRLQSQAGRSFWHSKANRLSMAIEQRQVFAFASLKEEPFDPHPSQRGVEIPLGFNEFRLGNDGFPVSPLSCWLENPSHILNWILADLPMQIPAQQVFFNFNILEKDQYETEIRLQFGNVSQARGMVSILNLARRYEPDNPISAVFFANPPVQDGSNVDIKSNILSEGEISLLLQMFLL